MSRAWKDANLQSIWRQFDVRLHDDATTAIWQLATDANSSTLVLCVSAKQVRLQHCFWQKCVKWQITFKLAKIIPCLGEG